MGHLHQPETLEQAREFLAWLADDLEHPEAEDRLDFFWHVLPTLTALAPYEAGLVASGDLPVIPHQAVIDKMGTYITEFRPDCRTVLHKPNHTGLAALYLHVVQRHHTFAVEDLRNSLLMWLAESRVVESDGSVHWHYSRSITAYVLIDLLLIQDDDVPTAPYVERVLKYLEPDESGSVPGDQTPTFDTPLHRESLYATMLSLRAIAVALKMYDPAQLTDCRSQAIVGARRRPLRQRVQRRYARVRQHIPVGLALTMTIGGAGMKVFNVGGADNLLFTGLGGLLGLMGAHVTDE